jgi:hypothetical protein
MTTSRRSVIATHVIAGKTRRCPVCLGVIEADHAEALAMHRGSLPNEFDAAALAREVEADRVHAELVADIDFVTLPPVRVSPNDTQPYLVLVDSIGPEPVGFEVVS